MHRSPTLVKKAQPLIFLACLLLLGSHSMQSQAPAKRGDSLGTTLKFLESSELLDLLNDRGNFTVFAPSDNAFNKLYQHNLPVAFKKGNPTGLKSLLAYHVVPGQLTASRILQALCQGEGATSFTTVQGEELLASMRGTDIILMDCSGREAVITQADSISGNLTLHRIDRVVFPSGIQPNARPLSPPTERALPATSVSDDK